MSQELLNQEYTLHIIQDGNKMELNWTHFSFMFGVFKIKHNCVIDIESGVYKNLMILREIPVLLEDTNFI